LAQPDEIFFDLKGKNLGFLGEIFHSKPEWLTQPVQQKIDTIRVKKI